MPRSLYSKFNNIVIKQVFFQHKMWVLRQKTFDFLALFLALNNEAINSGASVIKVKLT